MGFCKRRTRTLARINLLRIGIETDLNGADRQARQALNQRFIQTLAVGFDFQHHAGAAEIFRDVDEVIDDQRLAAAQHDIGNVGFNDFRGKCHGLRRRHFIRQRTARRRIRATMHACQIAIPRQLPGHKKRRAQIIDPVHAATYQASIAIAAVNSATAST